MYGVLVRRLREQRGLTQQQLAANAGLEQSNVSAIENGHRIPSVETFHRMVAACGFELVAVADEREVALPPPGEPHLLDEGDADEERLTDPGTSDELRNRFLVAALDVAEAIARNRQVRR